MGHVDRLLIGLLLLSQEVVGRYYLFSIHKGCSSVPYTKGDKEKKHLRFFPTHSCLPASFCSVKSKTHYPNELSPFNKIFIKTWLLYTGNLPLTISRPGNINLSLPQNQSAPGPLVVATLWTCYECIVQHFFKSSKNSVRSFGSCCITELSCSVRFLWVMITWTSSSTLSRFRIFRKKVKGLLISVLLLYSVLTYHLHHALNAVALSEAIYGFTELCAL